MGGDRSFVCDIRYFTRMALVFCVQVAQALVEMIGRGKLYYIYVQGKDAEDSVRTYFHQRRVAFRFIIINLEVSCDTGL
jgi:hypothetical protein